MLIYIIIFLFIICNGMKIAEANSFHKDYLQHESTLAVNGIFVILIFFSHCTERLTLDGVYDGVYITLKENLLQMVVVPFLFYSGYGIMESIKNKAGYARNILKNRFLKVLLHFDVAVLIYLCLQLLLGRSYSFSHIILALMGWTSVGNSNWYIFVTLVLYVLVFVAFGLRSIRKQKQIYYLLAASVLTVLVLLYINTMIHYGMPPRFYNTVLLFPFGMFYSLLRTNIEKVCMRNDICYTGCCVIVFVLYYYVYCHARESIIYYSLWGLFFMVLVLLFSMKFSLKNSFLIWLGKNVFGIYIFLLAKLYKSFFSNPFIIIILPP